MVGRGKAIADRVRLMLPQRGAGQRPMYAVDTDTAANGRKRKKGNTFWNRGQMKRDRVLVAQDEQKFAVVRDAAMQICPDQCVQ